VGHKDAFRPPLVAGSSYNSCQAVTGDSVNSMGEMRRTLAVVFSCLVLASCGGGGGGNSGGSATSGSNSGAYSPSEEGSGGLAVSLLSPTSVQGDYIEGDKSKLISVNVRASGDVAQLSTNTIYAVVEDPDSITGGAFVAVDQHHPAGSPSPEAVVSLFSRELDKPGHFRGELKLHACLDPNCASELAGSPLRIPYDIKVRAAVEMDTPTIAVTAPFGQEPQRKLVNVTLPLGLKTWGAQVTTPGGTSTLRVSTEQAGTSSGQLIVDFSVAPVGTHQETVKVYTSAQDQSGKLDVRNATVTVTYTVTPNPGVDFAISPAAGNFVRMRGQMVPPQNDARSIVVNEGVTMSPGTVEYLSVPPGAEGDMNSRGWWYESTGVAAACPLSCLREGTYTARVHYTVSREGASYDVYWPITLTITPVSF